MKPIEINTNAIRQIHYEMGVMIDDVIVEHGPNLDRYIVVPSHGTRISELRRAEPTIRKKVLGEEGLRTFLTGAGFVFETPLDDRVESTLESLTLTGSLGDVVYGMDVPFVAGADWTGKSVAVDLAETPGLLVVGEKDTITGQLCSAIQTLRELRPGDVRFTTVSCGEATLPSLPAEERFYGSGCATDPGEANAIIRMAACEIDRRLEKLKHDGYEDVWSQRRLSSQRQYQYLVVVLDRLDQLLGDRRCGEEIARNLLKIATTGRSAGILLIAGQSKPVCQQPLLNFNFGARLVSRISDPSAFLASGAEHLLAQGDALFYRGMCDEPERVATLSPTIL